MIVDLLSITVPIFGFILIGFIAVRLKLIPTNASNFLVQIIFYFFLPAILFFNLSKIEIVEMVQWDYILAYLVTTIIIILFTFVMSKKWFKRNSAETIINLMACVHTNTAYLALPLFLVVFNSVTPVAIVIVIQSLFNFLILAGLERARATTHTYHSDLYLIFTVARNPIILSTIFGLVVSTYALQIPVFFQNSFSNISPVATMIALFALGVSLNKKSLALSRKKYEISYLVFFKSIVHPLLGWLIAKFIFNLDPFWLKALILMCSMPTAQNLFVFSHKYQVGIERSNLIVLVSTIVSFISINLALIVM